MFVKLSESLLRLCQSLVIQEAVDCNVVELFQVTHHHNHSHHLLHLHNHHHLQNPNQDLLPNPNNHLLHHPIHHHSNPMNHLQKKKKKKYILNRVNFSMIVVEDGTRGSLLLLEIMKHRNNAEFEREKTLKLT